MKEKIKKILSSIIIGVLIIPTIAMGGSFVNSLVQGKSLPEAIQILVEQAESLTKQIESLTKRVEELEKAEKTLPAEDVSSVKEILLSGEDPPIEKIPPKEALPKPETIRCLGTDKSCGIYPSCMNCNIEGTGAGRVGDGVMGNAYIDYYCSEATCAYSTGTVVKGIISENAIWSLESSPYIVTGNILVDKGVTLVIEPGVEVKVRESKIEWQQHHIEVKGVLIAKGTENERILFTKEKFFEEPETRRSIENAWEGIQFSGCADWNERTNTGSIIEYSIIEYASRDKPAIGINGCSPLIKNNIIRHIGWDAIHVGRDVKNVKPKIINNKIQGGRVLVWVGTPYFSGNEISGEGFYIVGGSPTITRNNITNNHGDTYGAGIRIDSGSPIITYNNIIGNSANGIFIVGCRACNPVVERNNIYNNKAFSILLTDTKSAFGLPNNWWGTTNASVISSLIYDYYDDFNLGKVNYQPIATSEIPNAGPR